MTTTLFQLAIDSQEIDGEFAAALALLESDDPDDMQQAEQLISGVLERAASNKAALAAKADSICHVIEMMHGRAAYLRQVSAQRLERAKTEEHSAERLLQYLTRCMSAVNPGQKKFELPEHVLASRSSEAVEIDDPAEVPAEFRRNEIVIKIPACDHALTDELITLLAAHLSNKAGNLVSLDASSEPDKATIKAAIKSRVATFLADAQSSNLDASTFKGMTEHGAAEIAEFGVPGARLVKRTTWSIK